MKWSQLKKIKRLIITWTNDRLITSLDYIRNMVLKAIEVEKTP